MSMQKNKRKLIKGHVQYIYHSISINQIPEIHDLNEEEEGASKCRENYAKMFVEKKQ